MEASFEHTAPISRLTRLGSILLDQVIMAAIALISYLPAVAVSVFTSFDDDPANDTGVFDTPWIYVAYFGISLYFVKDSIEGRSVAKRMVRLQVINRATGRPAGPLRCLARNLTFLLWPVELVLALTNTSRRLGDHLANTELVPYAEKPARAAALWLQFGAAAALVYAATLATFNFFTPNVISIARVEYVESSYNPHSSHELQKQLQQVTPYQVRFQVKVFDTVRNETCRYVDVIADMQRNYLENNDISEQLQDRIQHQLSLTLNEDSTRGRILLRYRKPGFMQSLSSSFGTYKR